MSPMTLYFILMLDRIHGVLIVPAVLTGLATVIFTVMYFSAHFPDAYKEQECERYKKLAAKGLKFASPIFIVCMMVFAFLPGTKEMAAIYLVPKIVNNEQIQTITGNSLKILESYTQELLKDIAKEQSDKK